MAKVSKAAQEAAAKLNTRQLAFANFVLTKSEHGMSDADCYAKAGYKGKTRSSLEVRACQLLSNVKIVTYLAEMRKGVVEEAILSLDKLDKAIAEIMCADIGDYLETVERTRGGKVVGHVVVLKCNIQDLPPHVRRQIQEVRNTREGLMVKTYSRVEAIRMAGQRLGAFTDKHEHGGLGGGPLKAATITREMTADEAAGLYAEEVLNGD